MTIPPANNNRRILIIDDDTRIHADFRKILTHQVQLSELDKLESELFDQLPLSANRVYQLDSAYQGEEGCEKIKQSLQNGMPYAMAFVDMRMPPGWDGLETIKHIWAIDSKIQLVICTAYSDYSWNEVLHHLGSSDRLLILKKPFDMIEVQQIATALTTKWNLGEESLQRLQRIQESEEKFRAVVDSVADSIMTLDRNGNILFVNHNTWHSVNQIVGDNFYHSIKPEFREKFRESIDAVFAHGQHINVEYATENGSQNTIWSEGRISPYYKDNKIIAATLVASDISARKQLEWQLRHDELTSLPNRAYFSSYVEEKINQLRQSDDADYLLMFIDLDRFNLVNECFGHEIGDKLLVRVAKLLSTGLIGHDMLSRFGGDEFAIFKVCSKDMGKEQECAEAIKEILKSPININGFDIYPSASIGIVIGNKLYDNVAALLRDADTALYHAKSKGRNRYEYFNRNMYNAVVHRVRLGDELRQAIKHDQFVVYYQPMLHLNSDRVQHFEALVRWQHPERGLISPLEFIPVAEETGLIFSITHMMLEKVCCQLRRWNDAGYQHVRVSVNCSAREFYEQDLRHIISSIVERTGADIRSLELELTESSIMNDVQRAIESLQKMYDMGLKISIDDFGTGYSSFSYLKRFPISKLKIDRAFISDLPDDDDDSAIVEAIIAMAHRLRLEVVAEGVETPQQVNFLRRTQCNIIQGFLLGKPLDVEQATLCLTNPAWVGDKLLQQ